MICTACYRERHDTALLWGTCCDDALTIIEACWMCHRTVKLCSVDMSPSVSFVRNLTFVHRVPCEFSRFFSLDTSSFWFRKQHNLWPPQFMVSSYCTLIGHVPRWPYAVSLSKVIATHLRIRHKGYCTNDRSSNELQRLEYMARCQHSTPDNGHQSDAHSRLNTGVLHMKHNMNSMCPG